MSRKNTSGVKGICWNRAKNAWIARASVMGEQVTLRQAADFFEAVCAIKSYETHVEQLRG